MVTASLRSGSLDYQEICDGLQASPATLSPPSCPNKTIHCGGIAVRTANQGLPPVP